MANKPGKKDTAPRSTVSVYKRESFPVSKKSTASERKTKAGPTPLAKQRQKPPLKPLPEPASAADTTKKTSTKRQTAKARLIKSIYQGHDFVNDEVVRETDLLRSRGRKEPTAAPKESVLEAVSIDEPVTLPTAVNERLLSKRRALSRWYHDVFPQRVGRLLLGMGFVFMMAGAAGLLPFVKDAYPNWLVFQKTLWCEVRMCDDVVADSTLNDQLANLVAAQTPNAAVTFLTQPPELVNGTSTTIVRAEYVADLRVYAEDVYTGATFLLPFVGPPAGSDYTAEVSSEVLPSSKYQMRVEAKAARDMTKVMFSGALFTVGHTEPNGSTADVVVKESASTTEGAAGELSNEATSGTATSSEVVSDDVEVDEGDAADLTYNLKNSILSVSVVATDTQMVEVYAERTSATLPLFLGLGIHTSDGKWLLRHNVNSLPVGTYQLYAKKVSGGVAQETARLPFDFAGAGLKEGVSTSTPATRDTAEALAELTSDRPFPARSEYLASLLPGLEAAPEVKELLADKADVVNRLLLHYVSVAQANNEALSALVGEVTAIEIDRLAADAALSGLGKRTISQWTADITTAMTELQNQADGYERSLAERSGRSSVSDTDADGLSDYDEQIEYDTDPLLPDTDGDGITDGIEVLGQYSPDDSNDEVVQAYASPYEWGVAVPELLAITGVSPMIETDQARGLPEVMSEITGKAPPGSLVTLFVFSTPVLAIVRADEQGSFVYKLEKPLDDGEHTVFASLLDNRGTVIAKSEPYVFTKRHEFFRVQHDGDVAAVVATGVWSPTTSDLANIIIALCVMILGLGSLLIGYRLLRTKDEQAKESAINDGTEASPAAQIG